MLLVVFSVAMMCVSPVLATSSEYIKFYGNITDSNGDPMPGVEVEIKKEDGLIWNCIGKDTTDGNGYYEIGYEHLGLLYVEGKDDTYRMYIDGNEVQTQYIDDWVLDEVTGILIKKWYYSYEWNAEIPEFSTIAIPAAMVIGLVFFMQRRRD